MPAPRFLNAYADLPERFAAAIPAQPVKAPRLLILNRPLAEELGLEPAWLESEAGVAMLAGNAFPADAKPVATVYAGHQFGHFSPRLGDGRALLLGEVVDRAGQRRDIQLKGSGPTPFSRRGDGRSALGPALREYLISEAMAALGIPTTRSLAVVATGEPVFRETIQPGGIVARVAASHIRVGTFQYFASQGDTEAVALLVRMVIGRHYPHLETHENPPLALLHAVIERQASLIARWMNVGFIHGVMNTDNMTLSGETIDYGPCAFMDAYGSARVFSSIDAYGRYAYGNQPRIAHWNLARLAETLLPLLAPEPEKALQLATDAIDAFPKLFEAATTAGLRAKLGLAVEDNGDLALAQDLLAVMAANGADFTLAFRRLSEAESSPEGLDSFRQVFATTGGIDSWIGRWTMRLSLEVTSPAERRARMQAASPAIIPRNHAVEAALEAAVMNDDLAPFRRLHALLADPYSDHADANDLALPHAAPDPGYRTFCGT
ncbi:MAG: YdiU family protein [Methylocystis sp.]|nr:YdiU family protein [Methylocystis sp.]MCA3589229.1 YdiU family protein [Methylocystis sp.]MCA3593517.1 YdiU family protein [Methylocystis sp.]